MSFLCSCAGRRRKRDESDDRQEYYRRRSRSASRTPPPPLSAVTPKVKRKFPTGIAPTPSVPSDLEENSAAALALSAKKNTNNAGKTKDSNAATAAAKVKDPAAKVKTPTPKVTDPKLTTTDPKLKDASKFKDTAKVQFDEKQNNKKKNNRGGAAAAPVQTRTMGTMTAPGAGEVTGYEQTILPRVRKKSPPTVAARMEVTLKSMRRPGPISIPAPPLEDVTCGSSGSATPTGGYDGSVSSSDAMSSGGSPRDAQTQCAFSDFSDDESSLLSLGREEGEYESTVSELRDPSADPAGGPEVWDPGFLQHDRIWMDIKSTLMDLISDKDSPAFQELHDSMKPPDLTYCTVFRKMDGTVTHKAREDKKKARHSFGGVPAEKVPGSRSKLNLIALRDDESSDRNRNGLRRRSRMDGDEMDYEDLTPGSEYDDKLFTPDDEVTEYYFGRRSSSEPDVPFQSSETRLAPDAKITEFYFGQGASSDMDIPMRKSDSQITLRSFQGGTTSEALRSSMSAIWPTPTRDEKIGGSAVELTVPRTETDLPDKKVETATSTEDGDETKPSVENTQNVSVKEESKVETRLEEQNVQTEIAAEGTEVETVLSEQLSEAAPEVKMRQKITSRPFDRSMSESSSRGVREGTPVVQDLKTQKELWRQGVAFEGKDFEIGDAELESMEVEPVSPELHEKNRHHVKRVTRRKETSQLRSFSLDYEKRSPKVARKRPGRPIVVQPYSPTRTSQPPAKDHSKHKLKLKHEDRIDDTSSSVDDADSGDASKLATSADDASEISGEPVLPDSAVPSLARDKKGVKSSSPEETDSNLSPIDIVGPTTELRSPSMVRSVVAGRFTIETKQTQGRSIDSRKVDQNLQEATSPDQLSELSSGSANEESKTNSQSVPKPSPVSPKPKEKPKKHQEPSLFPAIDAESRFVSKPSEVKRSGKIELISVPPDDEDSEDTKARRTKKTRNVGRFLPRGGLKEIKTEETLTSYIPEEHSHATDLPDIGREIKKQESESSTTEPDLVLGHGSPHGSVDAQLLKFGNSLEDSMSKGSPDVIVQCFGEVSAASEDKKQLEELTESGSFEDFKARGGAFEKSATLFSAASTSVETVIAATKTKSELLEDDGLGSMDVDDVESKTDLETGNDAKQEKDDVKDGRNLTKRDLVEKYLPVRDSKERVTSAVVKTQYLRASNIESLPSKTETLVETVDSKKSSEPNVSVVERIFSDTATGNEDGITLNDSLKQVSNAPNVGTILPSGSSEPPVDSRKSLEAADKNIPQSPVLKETRGSGIEELIPSGFSENLVTSSNSSAALSGTSSGSFPEDIVPLLSPTSSSPPEFSPRSTSAGNGDSFLPGSGCTSPKRISSGSDSVHPLPKVETTVDETPLRYRPPEVTSVTTSPSTTTTTTTSRTPRVRLSDIIITGSGEEKLLALSTSPVNDIFLSDVSPDRQSVSTSPAFEQSVSTKQEGVAPDEKIPQTTRDLPAESVLSTKPQPQILDESTICPPTIPGPASNVDSGEVISSENKILDETSESLASPAVSQEKTGGNILSSLVEICDRFLSSSGKNVTASKLPSTSDVKDETRVGKSDEQVQSEEKDVEKDETKEKSPEKADALEGKSGKNGTKVKKAAKKGEKSEKKGEKSEKKTSKSKASAKAELPPFPPPDRPIRIAVRPSERMRALSKTSPTTQTSDSSDAVELSSDRESIPKAGPVSTDSVSESIPSDVKQKEAQGTDEAKQVTSVIDSATERKLESTVERLSTVVLPDSHIVSTPVVSQTSDETLKSIEKSEKTRDSVTAFADKIDRETQKIEDVPEVSAGIKFTDAISKEPSKRIEKISPDRDSLEETSIQSVQKTPRDSLEKEIPKEISGITLESPLPSPKDSLEAQSRRDSELTIDSIHRDSLSDIVPKAKSQSPCDSLDENTSTLVSATEKADPNIGDGVTSKSTPRDSLEGSPTKSLADVGPVKRASTVKSVDEDQILSFSSVWSPRISMQNASERITSPVSETVESRSATIIDARPFLAPSYSAEIAPPPWIADAIPEPPAAVPASSPPRGSFEEGVIEQPAAHMQASQLTASAGPSVPQNRSPIISPRDSFEGPSKQISKQLDRAASGENSLRDDLSSISSVTSPRDSLSSKRESSTTISDRLSTTDTSVIDDILGVGSIPLPKEWTDSPRASGSIPDSTPVRASLAVEEGLSSSSATSPRDSFEENQAKRILDPVPESPRVSQVVSMSRDSVASFSPLSTPRDSLDFGQQTKPSDSVPETPHRQSLVDSIKTGTSKADSSNVRDSFGSEKSSSPRISQKEITESFQKYFSSLDPTLAKLRDSQMSTGSGDSRRSAASDSDFDIIDFAEPDLMVLTDLPEEHHPSEQGAPTPTSNLPTEIPRPERSQSMLSGGYDIMYIDTSSFDDDKTPKPTSESESSPTREVAKVMEELASVLENAEKGFETDTSSVSSRHDSTPVVADRGSSKEKESDKSTPTITEETEKVSAETQLQKDRDVFRKIAESSMDVGLDIEASFEAMVNSLLTPRSSGITDENKKEEAKKSDSPSTSGVRKVTDDKMSIQNYANDPKSAAGKTESRIDRESATQVDDKTIVPQDKEISVVIEKLAEDSISDDKQHTVPVPKLDEESDIKAKELEHKVRQDPKGETGIRESTFGLAKKVQDILRRTPSIESQPDDGFKISKSSIKRVSKTSSTDVVDAFSNESRICESSGKTSNEEEPTQKMVDQVLESKNSLETNNKFETVKDDEKLITPEKHAETLEATNSNITTVTPEDISAIQKTSGQEIPEEKTSERKDSVQKFKKTKDTTSVTQTKLASDQISENDENKQTDKKSACTDVEGSSEKLNNMHEKEVPTPSNEKSHDKVVDSSVKEQFVQTDSKRRSKTKSKSLSQEKADLFDALSVAVEKNIPLPPDLESLETDLERDTLKNEKQSEEKSETISSINEATSQANLGHSTENIQNVITPKIELKENEEEKIPDKRRAGDWSKSFSLGSRGSLDKFEDEKETLQTTVRPEVKRTISSDSALEKKQQKSVKSKVITKSFSKKGEDRTGFPTESATGDKVDVKPIPISAEDVIDKDEESTSRASKRSSKSRSISREDKENESTGIKAEPCDNKEIAGNENIPLATERKKASSVPPTETDVSSQKAEDSGVEEDALQDHSESGKEPAKEKKPSSKKSKSRSREDVNSEELADLIQQQLLSIASGQVDDSQLEWTGPLRREKKSRKSVKTSKSRGEETDGQVDSSVVLPDDHSVQVEQNIEPRSVVETASAEDISPKTGLRRLKSRSKSREDDATCEKIPVDVISSPESTSRKESSPEKPKSILKSSSKEKVPVESPPVTAEITISQQENLPPFADPFSLRTTGAATDGLKRSDSKSSTEGVTSTSPELQGHLVKSSSFERTQDKFGEDPLWEDRERRNIRKIKSRSSSREDEQPLPDSSFDEKYVTSITESKPREGMKEFSEFAFSEPRSPRSLRRRSSSKSVSFEDDVILELVEDEIAEVSQMDNTESREDLESSEKPRKSKLERRKSPKKKSKSRSSDERQDLVFDSSFEVIPEDAPIFTEDRVNESLENVESYVKESPDSKYGQDNLKSKSKSLTPEKSMPSETSSEFSRQISDNRDDVDCFPIEENEKGKIERRKSPKKKSKSKTYDQGDVCSPTLQLLKDRSLRYVVTPDRELGPGNRSSETLQQQDFAAASTTDATESGSEFDFFVKERSSKDKLERRKSPKKKSKPKLSGTDEEDITSPEILIARVDEYFSSTSGTDARRSDADLLDEKLFTVIERRKSPKKKSKSKNAENDEQVAFVEGATVIENQSAVPKDEQLHHLEKTSQFLDETFEENWLQQPKVERRKSPKKKSKSKPSNQESEIPKPAPTGGDFYLPTVPAFQIDKSEALFEFSREPQEMPTEKTPALDSESKTQSAREKVAADRDSSMSVSEEKLTKTKSKSRSKSSDTESDRTIERSSSTHSQLEVEFSSSKQERPEKMKSREKTKSQEQADVIHTSTGKTSQDGVTSPPPARDNANLSEQGGAALVFENAPITQTENISSSSDTTRAENIQPVGAPSLDRIIVTQDSSESTNRLSSTSMLYPKSIDFFTTITSSRPESLEGHFPLSLPPSRTSLDLLAQKSTESLASNVSWNLPPKVDVRTMFVGNVTSPSKSDNEIVDFFTEQSTGIPSVEGGLKERDSSDSSKPQSIETLPSKSLSFEEALKSYREKNKKSEDESVSEVGPKPPPIENVSFTSGGSLDLVSSRSIEEPVTLVSSPIKGVSVEGLSKKSVSRTSSTSSEKLISKTSRSFEKSFEIPRSPEIVEKDSTFAATPSHSKPPSRANSTTSDKTVAKTQSFEISIEQPVSWDVEHFDLEQTSSIISRSKPVSRSSSTTSENVVTPGEALASSETENITKENDSSKVSHSKPPRRTSSVASDKSVSKHFQSLEKSSERPLSLVASFEVDTMPSTSRVKPQSRSSSTASDKSILKTKDSVENIFKQTSASDVEISEIQPASPVILRSKPPSRSSSTTSEKAASKVHSFDEAGPSISQEQTGEITTRSGNIEREAEGVPIAVSAPLRWSAALPENIDLSLDPTEDQEEQQGEAEEEDRGTEKLELKSLVPRAKSPALRKKVIPAEGKRDVSEIPSTTTNMPEKDMKNEGSETLMEETKPPVLSASLQAESETSIPTESKTSTESPSKEADAKTSTVGHKNIDALESKPVPTPKKKEKSTAQETIIPGAKSSPIPQRKQPASQSESESNVPKSFVQETRIPSAKASPLPQKKTTTSEPKSETRGQETQSTAVKSSPVPQRKATASQQKSDTPGEERRLTAAKSSPVPKKKTLPAETQSQESKVTAAKSSPVPKKKNISSETQGQESRLPAAKSSPAPQKKSIPSETQSQEAKLAAAKSSPAPQKKPTPSETQITETKSTAAKASLAPQKKSIPSETQSQEAKLTAAKPSPAPQKKPVQSETQSQEAKPTAAKSSPAPQKKPTPSETQIPETKPTAAKSSPAPQKKPSPSSPPKPETSPTTSEPKTKPRSVPETKVTAAAPAAMSAGETVRSAVRSVLDAAKQMLGVETPPSPRGRREKSRSPGRGVEPPSADLAAAAAPSPAARRRRARARRRAAAAEASTEVHPSSARSSIAGPLDWAAEVDAELPLDEEGDEEDEAAPPTPSSGRRKRKRHRRKRVRAAESGPALATPAPAATAPPAAAAAPTTAAAIAPPARIKRLKSCEEDSSDAAGVSSSEAAQPPRRPAAATACSPPLSPRSSTAAPDDDPTPWSVVRSRRHRRSRPRRPSALRPTGTTASAQPPRKTPSADGGGGSSDGGGFRFQEPPPREGAGLRLSSGSESAQVFFFEGGDSPAR